MAAIPGTVEEWVEIEPNYLGQPRWERTGHPEDGIICILPPKTFEQYYNERLLPNQGEILKALPQVAELIQLLASMDGPTIDTWANTNVSSLPEIRTFLKTLLKLLASRGL
jgi:hypothetical protein